MQNLNQRIGVQIRLKPMSARDTRDYICHRLKAATSKDQVEFTRMACRYIHLKTHGIARLVNRLCDVSLVGAYGKQCTKITVRIVASANREIIRQRCCGKTRSIFFSRRAVCTVLLCITISSAIFAAANFGGVYLRWRQLSAIWTPLFKTTTGADFSMPAHPTQTPSIQKRHAETDEAADVDHEQSKPNTAKPTTESLDAPIKAVVPNQLSAQGIQAAPQVETSKNTDGMKAWNKAFDAGPKQNFMVNVDAAKIKTGRGSPDGQNISDLIRKIIPQTSPDSEKPAPNPMKN